MSRIIEQTTNGIFATATAAAGFGVLSQENLLSVGALVGAGCAWGLKIYTDVRAKRRELKAADDKAKLDADMAELEARRKADQDGVLSWKKMIADAAQEVGDARSELKTAKAQIADLKAQNGSQASQIKLLEDKVKILADSQKEVVKSTNKQKDRVTAVTERVGAVEQALGSSSNLSLPSAEPSTAIDLPNIE